MARVGGVEIESVSEAAAPVEHFDLAAEVRLVGITFGFAGEVAYLDVNGHDLAGPECVAAFERLIDAEAGRRLHGAAVTKSRDLKCGVRTQRRRGCFQVRD